MPYKKRLTVLYVRLDEEASRFVGQEQLRTQHFQSDIVNEALRAAAEKRQYKLDPKVFKTLVAHEKAVASRQRRAKRRT